MEKNDNSFFWGMLLAAAAAAVAGAVALTRSFRSSRDGCATWNNSPKDKGGSLPGRPAKKSSFRRH
jgi:hypothetical protein